MSGSASGGDGGLEVATDAAGAISVRVKVVPRASRDAFAGARQGALLVRLTAPPAEGRANEALIRLLSRALGLPRGRIQIIAGASARTKRLRIEGTTAVAVSSLAATG